MAPGKGEVVLELDDSPGRIRQVDAARGIQDSSVGCMPKHG